MKKILIGIQLLFLAIAAHATGQKGDIIYIDGTRWELLGRPVCMDSLLYHDLLAVLPSERSKTTANWDGFTAYWSNVHDVLCLDSIRYGRYEEVSHDYVGERVPTDTLMRVFRDYVDGQRMVAGWLTGDIRVATGKEIYYEHIGFARNYEHEQILTIDKGRITEKKDYHNHVDDGFSFDQDKRIRDLRKLFPLKTEKWPELAKANRILFYVSHARVDGKGNLVECDVKVVSPKVNQQIGQEMARLLKAYRPWKVSFINGEYRADGIEHWYFPYPLDQ